MNKSLTWDYEAMRSQTDQLRDDIEIAQEIDYKLRRRALQATAAEEAKSEKAKEKVNGTFSLKLDYEHYSEHSGNQTYKDLDRYAQQCIMQNITVGYDRPDIQILGVQLYDCRDDLVTDNEACYDRTAWPLYAEYRRTNERYCAHNGSWLCDPSVGDLRTRLQSTLNRLSKRTDDHQALDPLWRQLESLTSALPLLRLE